MEQRALNHNVPESLSFKELIYRVTQDLIESQEEREARGQASLFEVERLRIEINVVVTTTSEAKGGIDFKIVTVGGGTQFADQQVQKITLELKVVPENDVSATIFTSDGRKRSSGRRPGSRPGRRPK